MRLEAEPAQEGPRAYEQARFDRTARITNESWSLGKVIMYENPLKWAFVGFAILLGGAGRFTVDRARGREI